VNGVVYVAYGAQAVEEATKSIRSLKKHCSLPVTVIGDKVAGVPGQLTGSQAGRPGRWAKTRLYHLSPYDRTLYVDADTRIHGNVEWGFEALEAGWDMVIVPSKAQGEPLHHLGKNEREVTLIELHNSFPLMLNSGVMWFDKNERTRALFGGWHDEWLRWQQHDQGALLRALRRHPVYLLIAGRPYNDGEIVEHLFGRIK
jgi:hypothetical protein